MITEIAVSFSIPQKFLPIRMLLFQISYGCYIVYLRKSKINLAKLRHIFMNLASSADLRVRAIKRRLLPAPEKSRFKARIRGH